MIDKLKEGLSEREIDQFENMEDWNSAAELEEKRLSRACEIAFEAYEGQTRHDGTPYIQHANRIAKEIEKYFPEKNARAIAVLHDVLEQSDFTYEELNKQVGSYIADEVLVLTRKEGQTFEEYFRPITEHILVLIVKMIERIDNVRSLKLCENPQKSREYIDETENVLIPMIKECWLMEAPDIQKLMQELNNAVVEIRKQ